MNDKNILTISTNSVFDSKFISKLKRNSVAGFDGDRTNIANSNKIYKKSKEAKLDIITHTAIYSKANHREAYKANTKDVKNLVIDCINKDVLLIYSTRVYKGDQNPYQQFCL